MTRKPIGKLNHLKKPDDDGVNVLVPALHPRQAPHPELDVYLLVTIEVKRYALLNHVGVEVKLLSEGRVQSHQLSSLAVLRNIVLYMAPSRVCTEGYRVVFGPFKSVFLTSGIPITPLRATLFFFTKAVTSSRELGGFCLESTLKSRKTNLLAPLFTSEKYTSSKSIYELKTRLPPTIN